MTAIDRRLRNAIDDDGRKFRAVCREVNQLLPPGHAALTENALSALATRRRTPTQAEREALARVLGKHTFELF